VTRCERLRGAPKPGGARRGSRSLKRKGKEIGAARVLIGPDNPATFVPPNRSQSGSQGCERTGVLRDAFPPLKGGGSIEAIGMMFAVASGAFAFRP